MTPDILAESYESCLHNIRASTNQIKIVYFAKARPGKAQRKGFQRSKPLKGFFKNKDSFVGTFLTTWQR